MVSDATVTEKELLDVSKNYNDVLERVRKASESSGAENVRLVAVSKTKPVELLQAVYDGGCRCFGENYVQEMVDKVPKMAKDIEWHFIGALQSNKCNTLVKAMDGSVERLTVETVSSTKLANKLNNAFESDNQRLKVFVQVNTSGEDSKSGVEPGAETIELCKHIVENCPQLDLRGLMTIGAVGDESCFTRLAECKNEVEKEIPAFQNLLELSMGMSGDFETAIASGATNVRVGSTIFGERDYSK